MPNKLLQKIEAVINELEISVTIQIKTNLSIGEPKQ